MQLMHLMGNIQYVVGSSNESRLVALMTLEITYQVRLMKVVNYFFLY
jgi:hypothetical protein